MMAADSQPQTWYGLRALLMDWPGGPPESNFTRDDTVELESLRPGELRLH